MSKLAVVLLALVVAVNTQVLTQHDLNLGVVGPQDKLLFSRSYTKSAVPFTQRTTDVNFPSSGVINNAVITAVLVQDNIGKGNGGYPAIRTGGLGQRYVNIRLTSQRGKSTDFTVQIFGQG